MFARIEKIHAKIRDATVALTAYEVLGVNDTEKAALRDLGRAGARYADAGSGPVSPATAIFATLPVTTSGHPGNLGLIDR